LEILVIKKKGVLYFPLGKSLESQNTHENPPTFLKRTWP